MKKIRWAPILIVANLIAINWIVIRYLNFFYPSVGHDYSITIPSMLDIYNHYRVNGISIQWYTPTFGGGLPAFPDPNNGQFSLLAFLPLLVNPWQAVMISSIVYIALGGIACYYLFNRVLKLHWTSSILGMIFFSANGFIVQRIAVGHIGYQTFPVIAILVITLLDPAIPRAIAGLIFSLLVAMLIYYAGYMLIVIFGLSILILLPLVYLYKPALFSWKRILTTLSMGGIVAFVISVSKLAAVYAFMRFFPRQIADEYSTSSPFLALLGIFLQLLGTMNLVPLAWAAGLNPNLLPANMTGVTGALYGYWEFDMSLSPVVIVIMIIGVYSLLRNPKKHSSLFNSKKKWLAWAMLVFFTWLTIEFILAKGLIYPILRTLPVLSSLHVNPRFTAAFLFPLALVAALFYNRWVSKYSGKKSFFIFLVMNILTLLPLCSYFMIHDDLQDRSYNITESEKIYTAIRAGDTLNVTGIADDLDNTQALGNHMSNLYPYNPIFGYGLENFHPEIKVGSIWDVSDGYYNMTNPAGYVFPEINGIRPYERIPVGDEEKLEAFANHLQPDWKIPVYQQVLNWVSGLAFWAVLAILIFYAGRGFIRRLRKPGGVG